MELSLSSWGNSLGLRIPKSIAKMMGLGEGSKVIAKLKGESLVLSPRTKAASLKALGKNINLKLMASRVTPQNKHFEDEDGPAGNEVW